jgi:hypothetical protein
MANPILTAQFNLASAGDWNKSLQQIRASSTVAPTDDQWNIFLNQQSARITEIETERSELSKSFQYTGFKYGKSNFETPALTESHELFLGKAAKEIHAMQQAIDTHSKNVLAKEEELMKEFQRYCHTELGAPNAETDEEVKKKEEQAVENFKTDSNRRMLNAVNATLQVNQNTTGVEATRVDESGMGASATVGDVIPEKEKYHFTDGNGGFSISKDHKLNISLSTEISTTAADFGTNVKHGIMEGLKLHNWVKNLLTGGKTLKEELEQNKAKAFRGVVQPKVRLAVDEFHKHLNDIGKTPAAEREKILKEGITLTCGLTNREAYKDDGRKAKIEDSDKYAVQAGYVFGLLEKDISVKNYKELLSEADQKRYEAIHEVKGKPLPVPDKPKANETANNAANTAPTPGNPAPRQMH